MTKNITVSVPDPVYRAARIRAAEQGTSVSALFGEFLRSLSGRTSEEFCALEERQREIQDAVRNFRAGDRLGRDELHERAVR